MSKINKLADGIIEDTLKEAADTFFGRRRDIEHEVNLFEQKVKELRPLARKIEQTVQSLNFLLLEGREVENFWSYLKIEFPLDIVSVWQLDVTVPFGLTIKSKYTKILVYIYTTLSKLIEEYSHGKEVKDTEIKGRKLITVNYNFLQKWVAEINEKIDDINYYHKPSDVLQFAKKMHVAEMEKEMIAGAPMKYTIDKELHMDKMNFSDYKLIKYPDLPCDNKTIKQIKQFAHDTVKKNEQEIKIIIQRIAK